MNSIYELIDFGNGRKLERFGHLVLDRPSPAAERHEPAEPHAWQQANAVYHRAHGSSGEWHHEEPVEAWQVELNDATFTLQLTEFGHLGIFPEQQSNWSWIRRQVEIHPRPLKVLNLFGYTGGSTMAAALAGADEVVHIDSAKNTVAWARRNAELTGLADAPIRWIAEDARKFVEREVKRGNQYDAVILDPPSYGHGPKGEVFRLTDDLMPLLENCRELTRDSRAFMLLTCHSPGYGPAELEACLADAVFGACSAGARARRMNLQTADGRRLNAGVSARWPG